MVGKRIFNMNVTMNWNALSSIVTAGHNGIQSNKMSYECFITGYECIRMTFMESKCYHCVYIVTGESNSTNRICIRIETRSGRGLGH